MNPPVICTPEQADSILEIIDSLELIKSSDLNSSLSRIGMIEDGIPSHRSHFILVKKHLKRDDSIHLKDKDRRLKIQNALQIINGLLSPS